MAAFINSSGAQTSVPSVFEVVAQESLINTLKPAFDQIMRVAAQSHPTHLRYIHVYRDEIFLLLNSALQVHYLKRFSSSFSENFYGLARESRRGKTLCVNMSFACLVLLPYLQRKLQRCFDHFRGEEADGTNNNSIAKNKIRTVFIKLYPYFHCFWELSNLGILLLYCLHKSKYHSVFALLAGYHLVYANQVNQSESTGVRSGKTSLQSLLSRTVSTAARGITFGLEVGSFFLQVVDHWYNNVHTETKLLNQVVGPPPLVPDLVPGVCPLCQRTRRGHTVLASSGVIYCYACITKYIRKKRKCPLTKMPADETELVRIFYSND